MLQRLTETTMSNPHLPAEMLDHVIDQLHDTRDALRSCCLVSKSWVPRSRTHLFADIEFPTTKSLEVWKETFPDPSTSPAWYAKTLSIDCATTEAGSWIKDFPRVEHLEVATHGTKPDFDQSATPLVPFHGFPPALKSLRVVVPHLPPSQIFNLIFSFPLLEDLAVVIPCEAPIDNGDDPGEDEMPTAAQSPTPPTFTGSLELYLQGGMEPFTRRLLSIPGGIHFRKLTLTWFHGEDISLMMALVEECAHTLESLDITCNHFGTSIRYLCLHQHLTPVSRRVEVASG
jgi:hypothetical protein